jgi:hypothetical protein
MEAISAMPDIDRTRVGRSQGFGLAGVSLTFLPRGARLPLPARLRLNATIGAAPRGGKQGRP